MASQSLSLTPYPCFSFHSECSASQRSFPRRLRLLFRRRGRRDPPMADLSRCSFWRLARQTGKITGSECSSATWAMPLPPRRRHNQSAAISPRITHPRQIIAANRESIRQPPAPPPGSSNSPGTRCASIRSSPIPIAANLRKHPDRSLSTSALHLTSPRRSRAAHCGGTSVAVNVGACVHMVGSVIEGEGLSIVDC